MRTPHIAAPAGTVTFLFTDIEASSRHWDTDHDGMSNALRRHDSIVREALRAHGGYVFKTVGDAFCAAFKSAPDAIAAALDAQRALAAQDFDDIGGLRVRMALHSGDCEHRNGDYFGPALNRTSRLMDIAHGGQIVLSRTTADLIGDRLPPGTALADLGTHRLKDLAQPEHVQQLISPDLRSQFPALRSLQTHPNNLPFQLTSFIGRQNEIAQVLSLLEERRLVTLIGSGGVGKTRLALHVGAEVLGKFADGVSFVDLAPVRDPQFVPSAVAKSLGLVEMADVSVTELVAGYLRERCVLLILDNCEHLIGAAAVLVNELLRRCKDVRVLATSREPLNIPGEHSLRVASLPEGDAVALFIDRATSVNPQFETTAESCAQIADLCRRLDGIALAIELAAARAKVLSVEHLNQKLNDRFRILTIGSRTALPRHQTMRALIDWSYDLLAPTEQTLFRRFSVFANGWTLPQACAVCGFDLEEWDVVDGLASLVDKSLVVAEVAASTERFKLYESTRRYALERLNDSGERETLERAHAAEFAAVAKRSDEIWEDTPTAAWLDQLLPEEDNFRAALHWTLEQKRDAELGVRLVCYLPRFWWTGGRQIEGIRWYDAALITAQVREADVPTMARLRYGLAVMYSTTLMRRDARENAELAVTLSRDSGDALLLGWSVLVLGVACALMGDPQAGRKHCREGMEIAGGLNATRLMAWLSWAHALNDSVAGQFDAARVELNEQLAVCKRLGDDLLLGFALIFLGIVELGTGNGQRSLECTREALELYRQKGDRVGLALAWSNIAPAYLVLGQIDDVREAAREALSYARDTHNSRLIVIALEYLAAAALQRPTAAACLLGFCDAWYATSATPRDLTEQQTQRRTLEGLRAALPGAELQTSLEAGARMTQAQAIETALQR